MKKLSWGIIGCGDVTEVKSGPAFQKAENSSLVAVMRRNGTLAEDYARRHGVPKWYDDAAALINDPEVNAIYIATPPSSHEEYALAALAAGKPVYVEKPMTLNAESARRMSQAVKEHDGKLVVAHYRRQQPVFKKVKQLLDEKAIGEIRFASIDFRKAVLTEEELLVPRTAWRVDAQKAGGGLFHDLAPHQLDLMYHFFGEIQTASGIAVNQAGVYTADDMVAGTILFKNGVVFSGTWSFAVSKEQETDRCIIAGSEGEIRFSIFDHAPVVLAVRGDTTSFEFDPLPHVQQPMIQAVTDHFLGKGPNPCTVEQGVAVMELLDSFTRREGR
ncbi:Gfo/Idh/MocA family oxidoreductase [Terrimonas sp. NA20]|uniref:Gfo/Idh/MocA family oxidoreductase n=1 Tax=Terrimonas ginsenosidimutans TaxID=2908004 RepID=A0ABS9KYN8_9BACT|nr:Gfo/Idh/MocA family oxidoreductase [Terrimonas ginsenosidimutans]MCG2617334.1 Gfo/Idh/MocA family oxidoreductase [Terrimonas ginsenosidimutans]